jgi:hypothetical protein
MGNCRSAHVVPTAVTLCRSLANSLATNLRANCCSSSQLLRLAIVLGALVKPGDYRALSALRCMSVSRYPGRRNHPPSEYMISTSIILPRLAEVRVGGVRRYAASLAGSAAICRSATVCYAVEYSGGLCGRQSRSLRAFTSIFRMTCPECGSAMESGTLLTFSMVRWSLRPRPWFPSTLIHRGGRGQHFYPPVSLPAERCQRCRVCFFRLNEACRHEFQKGWVLPWGKLWWLPAGVDFQPTFWWPITRRLRTGHILELLYSPGFRLTVAGGRRPGFKCARCEAAGVFYGRTQDRRAAA